MDDDKNNQAQIDTHTVDSYLDDHFRTLVIELKNNDHDTDNQIDIAERMQEVIKVIRAFDRLVPRS